MLIQIFGALVLLAGIIILIKPETIFGPLQKHIDKPGLQITAAGVRLVIGVLLILQAEASKFPFAILILGCASVVVALSLLLIGKTRFTRLMKWSFSLLKPWGRLGGIFAVVFGAFLIYAFLPA